MTTKRQKRTWLVWHAEYPEDGSVEVRATSAAGAKAEYRRGTGDHGVALRAALMTPEIRAERRKAER